MTSDATEINLLLSIREAMAAFDISPSVAPNDAIVPDRFFFQKAIVAS